MAIYHIAYHGYRVKPSPEQFDAQAAMLNAAFAFAVHMRAPHGPDEATHLKENVARVRAFDIITPDSPPGTAEAVLALYKERWELFPDVAKALREDVDTHFPYL